MKLKEDTDTVLRRIEDRVREQVKMAFTCPPPSYYGEEVKISINDVISKAIAEGVVVGIATLLQNQYTQEDFEKDVGLSE